MEIVRQSIRVPPDSSRLFEVREAIYRLCENEAVPESTTRLVVLAVDEALANILEHGRLDGDSDGIALSVEIGERKVVAEIADQGIPFDPTSSRKLPVQCPLPKRGFGLYLMHKVVDHMEYERTSDGQNVLTLTKAFE